MQEEGDGYQQAEGLCPPSGVEDCGAFKKVIG